MYCILRSSSHFFSKRFVFFAETGGETGPFDVANDLRGKAAKAKEDMETSVDQRKNPNVKVEDVATIAAKKMNEINTKAEESTKPFQGGGSGNPETKKQAIQVIEFAKIDTLKQIQHYKEIYEAKEHLVVLQMNLEDKLGPVEKYGTKELSSFHEAFDLLDAASQEIKTMKILPEAFRDRDSLMEYIRGYQKSLTALERGIVSDKVDEMRSPNDNEEALDKNDDPRLLDITDLQDRVNESRALVDAAKRLGLQNDVEFLTAQIDRESGILSKAQGKFVEKSGSEDLQKKHKDLQNANKIYNEAVDTYNAVAHGASKDDRDKAHDKLLEAENVLKKAKEDFQLEATSSEIDRYDGLLRKDLEQKDPANRKFTDEDVIYLRSLRERLDLIKDKHDKDYNHALVDYNNAVANGASKKDIDKAHQKLVEAEEDHKKSGEFDAKITNQRREINETIDKAMELILSNDPDLRDKWLRHRMNLRDFNANINNHPDIAEYNQSRILAELKQDGHNIEQLSYQRQQDRLTSQLEEHLNKNNFDSVKRDLEDLKGFRNSLVKRRAQVSDQGFWNVLDQQIVKLSEIIVQKQASFIENSGSPKLQAAYQQLLSLNDKFNAAKTAYENARKNPSSSIDFSRNAYIKAMTDLDKAKAVVASLSDQVKSSKGSEQGSDPQVVEIASKAEDKKAKNVKTAQLDGTKPGQKKAA